MSSLSIPAAAQPGQLVVDINLVGRDDQQQLLDKLKRALNLLLTSGSGKIPAVPPAPAVVPPPAPAPAPLPMQPGAAPPPLPRMPATAPPPQPQQPATVPAAQPPQPAASSAAPAAAAVGGAAAAAAGVGGGLSWQLCWTTDAADHSSDPIGSMAYLPQISGLPGGDGHAGWLISSSRGLLNLWEASPSGGRGEPALMCMHSQATDYSPVCLEGERGTGMLLGAATDRSGSEWVTAHSLEADTLLAPRGRCPMPHSAANKIAGQNCLTLASLHGMGGPLAETCAASYGGALVVWPVGNTSKPAASNTATPGSVPYKALWKAHDSLITALHRSAHDLNLWSGAADGKVHLYNMRERPNRPQATLLHQGRVTGLHQLNDSQLLSAAADGRLMVWDLRNTEAGPMKFAVPDTKPITRMCVSPFADCVALSTTAGLYCVDLLDSACTATQLAAALRSPVTALAWNTATSEVVVGGGPGPAGTISVFKQRLAAY